MSEEKKGVVTELKVPFRYATPAMLERAEQLEELAAKIRKGSVCGVALVYVEEINGADANVYKHWTFENRRYALIGGASTLCAHLQFEAMAAAQDV